jgi:bacillithiol biosynthesis deacetylase BshB1
MKNIGDIYVQKSSHPTVDFVAFGAHPDDVEACAGGLVSILTKAGLSGAKVDMSTGNLANSGSGVIRTKEAQAAAKILGLNHNYNLGLPDRELDKYPEYEDLLIDKIREYRPRIVIAPIWDDKHIDHVACSKLVTRALSGAKYDKVKGKFGLPAHRVEAVYYYVIHHEVPPTFIVDITSVYEQKMTALFAHKSQMFREGTKELLDPDFIENWENRAKTYGYKIGVKYGEPYVMKTPLGLGSITPIIQKPLL